MSKSKTVVHKIRELHKEKAQQLSIPMTPAACGGIEFLQRTENGSRRSQKANNNHLVYIMNYYIQFLPDTTLARVIIHNRKQ